VGVIKGMSPKTLEQQFRLATKEQLRYKKYAARVKQATRWKMCLPGLLQW